MPHRLRVFLLVTALASSTLLGGCAAQTKRVAASEPPSDAGPPVSVTPYAELPYSQREPQYFVCLYRPDAKQNSFTLITPYGETLRHDFPESLGLTGKAQVRLSNEGAYFKHRARSLYVFIQKPGHDLIEVRFPREGDAYIVQTESGWVTYPKDYATTDETLTLRIMENGDGKYSISHNSGSGSGPLNWHWYTPRN